MRAQWLTKIVVFALRVVVDLEPGDQTFRVFVFMEKFERTGQINAGQIVLPFVPVFFVEVIAQIKNVIGCDDAFAREHINRVGNPARVDEVRGFARNHFL